MSTNLPPSPPAQVRPQVPAYPILGLSFSGDPEAVSNLRSFAEGEGIKLGPSELHDGIETVHMPPDKSVTNPAFMALVTEAQSGRLGKLRTGIIVGPRPAVK